MYKQCIDIFNNGLAKCVIRAEDGAVIPFDPANTDYQEFLCWCEQGNTPLPADELNV